MIENVEEPSEPLMARRNIACNAGSEPIHSTKGVSRSPPCTIDVYTCTATPRRHTRTRRTMGSSGSRGSNALAVVATIGGVTGARSPCAGRACWRNRWGSSCGRYRQRRLLIRLHDTSEAEGDIFAPQGPARCAHGSGHAQSKHQPCCPGTYAFCFRLFIATPTICGLLMPEATPGLLARWFANPFSAAIIAAGESAPDIAAQNAGQSMAGDWVNCGYRTRKPPPWPKNEQSPSHTHAWEVNWDGGGTVRSVDESAMVRDDA